MIGIFGGTFDPVHYGHIKPVLDVKQSLGLEELRFIPCSVPAHRAAPVATVAQRLAMLHAAIDEYENCIIDERELNRQGVSYMVDTLQILQYDLSGKVFCLIIGMDAFFGLNQWYQWQRIFSLANCVVTYRPGFELNLAQLPADLCSEVKQRQIDSIKAFAGQQQGAIFFMPVTQIDISATDIRQRIKNKQSIEEFVPPAVNNVIQQQKIYAG